jgi:hypothetical protein
MKKILIWLCRLCKPHCPKRERPEYIWMEMEESVCVTRLPMPGDPLICRGTGRTYRTFVAMALFIQNYTPRGKPLNLVYVANQGAMDEIKTVGFNLFREMGISIERHGAGEYTLSCMSNIGRSVNVKLTLRRQAQERFHFDNQSEIVFHDHDMGGLIRRGLMETKWTKLKY